MKALCHYTKSNGNKNLCFTKNHMFDVINKHIKCISSCDTPEIWSFDPDITHFLILDVDYEDLAQKMDLLRRLKTQGAKFVLLTFDPPNFWFVDKLAEEGILDKVILFDSQFVEYFSRHSNIKIYVSDYFFNEDLFEIIPSDTKNHSQVCVFGHLLYSRANRPTYGAVKVDGGRLANDPVSVGINSYQQLYNKVQLFNGAIIHDLGHWVDMTEIHYNKAKAVEALMCGVYAYCYPGINTKRYNKFLKDIKEDDNGDLIIHPIEFDTSVIQKINTLTIEELIGEIKNT